MKQVDQKKAMKIIGFTLIIFILTVATHDGEFWPFSTYPMFSQAGNPWTRAMILDVSDQDEETFWQSHSLNERSTPSLSLRKYGVDQIDFSNFISKTDHWSDNRKNALFTLFKNDLLPDGKWMVVKVRGELVNKDSVHVRIQPFLLLTENGVVENPLLDDSFYFRGEN